MDGQILTSMYNSWFEKLKPKEQRLVFALIVVLTFVIFLNICLKPIYTELTKFNKEKNDIQSRVKLLSSQFVDTGKIKSELEDIRKNISVKKIHADKIESELLNVSQIPYLLTQLVKCVQGLAIDIESVKQEIQTDKEGFNRLYIDSKFTAKYEEGVNYIKRIEGISPFVKIEELDIVQSKSDPRNLISVSLKLSALLAVNSVSKAELSKCEDTGIALNVGRNPLTPKFSLALTKKQPLKLTGITYCSNDQASTAIINDTVVRRDDIIEGFKVEEILYDSVGVNDGIETKALKIER